MFNIMKKNPPTDFELRNDAARRAYTIREAKKEIARNFATGILALSIISVTAVIIGKKLENNALIEEN